MMMFSNRGIIDVYCLVVCPSTSGTGRTAGRKNSNPEGPEDEGVFITTIASLPADSTAATEAWALIQDCQDDRGRRGSLRDPSLALNHLSG
jgi:hypothetical protein